MMTKNKPKLNTHNSECRAGGFTLLEVMIALAIIGSTIAVILNTVNYQSTILYDNTITTQMYQLAKEKMNELEKKPLNSNGPFEKTKFKYTNTASRMEGSDIVELTTVVSGLDKEVVLKRLIIVRMEG